MTMKRRTMRRRHSRSRRGTAIVEFALALPLLAGVLLLTFSFGWAMTNQQHVWAADRYACWRQVRTGIETTGDQINQGFFNGRASSVGVNYATKWDGSTDALIDYVEEVSSGSAAAGELAQELIFNNHFPLDERVTLSADFPTKNLFWKRFSGAMQSRDSRAGLEWRWRQARCENEVADQRLPAVDGLLRTAPAPADVLARFFRGLYREGWHYHDWPYGSDGNMN